MKLPEGGAGLQDGCNEFTGERGIWWEGENQMKRLGEQCWREDNGEVSFKGFQW